MDRGQGKDGVSVVREERLGKRLFRSSVAAPGVGLGGIILVVGTLLTWASRSRKSGGTFSFHGFSLQDGRVVMGIGFALLVMGVIMWAVRRIDSWFDANLLAVALSTAAVAVTATRLAQILDAGTLSAEVGIYITIAGALIVWIAGLAGIFASRSDRVSEEYGRVGSRRAA
jgi:hypothetical protein